MATASARRPWTSGRKPLSLRSPLPGSLSATDGEVSATDGDGPLSPCGSISVVLCLCINLRYRTSPGETIWLVQRIAGYGTSMTTQVRLSYGDDGLDIAVPDDAVVVYPQDAPAVPDSAAALTRALREPVSGAPLRERIHRGQTVAISVCDGTRPQPRQLMIPAVLSELDGIVDSSDIVILIATGTHRA